MCTSPVHCLFTSTEVFKVATPSAHKKCSWAVSKACKALVYRGEQSWISLSTPVYFAVIVHWDSSVDCAILYKDACAPEYIMLLYYKYLVTSYIQISNNNHPMAVNITFHVYYYRVTVKTIYSDKYYSVTLGNNHDYLVQITSLVTLHSLS